MRSLLEAHGYDVHVVERRRPAAPCIEAFAHDARRLLRADPRDPGDGARSGRRGPRPRWPAIVLRTPKGWTGPKVVDGVPVEGTFRAHQVPLANVAHATRSTSQMLEEWMRSYRPEELFDGGGRLVAELAALAPRGDRRMGANPHANGGRLLRRPASCPTSASTRSPVDTRRRASTSRRAGSASCCATSTRDNPAHELPPLLPRRDQLATGSAPSSTVENRCFEEPIIPIDDHVAPDGRVMEVL